MYLRSRRRLGDGFNHEIHEKNVEMYACAARRRLGTTWANGLGREALLRAPDLSRGLLRLSLRESSSLCSSADLTPSAQAHFRRRARSKPSSSRQRPFAATTIVLAMLKMPPQGKFLKLRFMKLEAERTLPTEMGQRAWDFVGDAKGCERKDKGFRRVRRQRRQVRDSA